MLQLRACDFPSPVFAPLHSTREAHFDMVFARNHLVRVQYQLDQARAHGCREAVGHWERAVCDALDRVFEAQENFQVIRRHWA